MPPSRRQQDFSYNPIPPNMRSPQYMGYPPMNGHMPPIYSPQQYPHWYPPYGHMQPPQRAYHPQYGPMIVSSYPHSQPVMAPTHLPHHPMHMQQRTPTPHQQPIMTPPILHPSMPPMQPDLQENSVALSHSTPPPRWEEKTNLPPKPAFTPPVCFGSLIYPMYAVLDGFLTNQKLPWLSVPEQSFPARIPRKRRKGRVMQSSVELPSKDPPQTMEETPNEKPKPSNESIQEESEPQTPTTFQQSDTDSTQPTTPSSVARSQAHSKTSKQAPTPVFPAVPNVAATPRKHARDSSSVASGTPKSTAAATPAQAVEPDTAVHAEVKPSSPITTVPKSWADLVRSKASAKAASAAAASAESTGMPAQKNENLADVLSGLGEDVTQYSDKIAFLEPRGLVNTGNMCYMNSVLQILVSCTPFYQFLDHLGRRAAHSFHSDLPLIDAMIMFMKEFRVIDAATSEDQLRLRLKANELEQYGDAFAPEFVYDMVRQLPRFRDMRRGHQQDAQEFLGFLLEEMHEECARAEEHTSKKQAGDDSVVDGWLEVGHKQKAAVTQLSGAMSSESPVTRIFGGKLRSEFKVPGNKTSVTLEPYQPLQLDIGSHDVHNILDALKGLTKPESIQGDFNSSRGSNVTATKQIFIETLPPVLILHLKRFHYDSHTGATQKIWKKVGYPLELDLPREVFPLHQRNAFATNGGPPKYRLMGVIYHHGKNASGGHYTVDVRRQEGLEWIRMDDTVIRRVRSEDVAEAGGEEDPKILAAALEQQKNSKTPNGNIFDHIDQDDMDSADNDKGWSQVNGNGVNGHASKKSVNVNGATSSPAASSGVRTPLGRYGSRDNKVAYLLFYQRMD
jgi:ubiquitin carboxyl-terminal hydrolase 10